MLFKMQREEEKQLIWKVPLLLKKIFIAIDKSRKDSLSVLASSL